MRTLVPALSLLLLPAAGRAATVPEGSGDAATAPAGGDLPDVNSKVKSGQRSSADAAVVVGIENYPFLPEVPYALRDADAFYNFLVYTRGVSPTRTTLLTSNPTASDVREALRQRAAEVGPGGTLWLYFAGHGAADPETGERLLLGVDVQPKVTSLNDTQTFSLVELDAIAAGSPATQLVAVVDACYTGTGRDGKVLLEGKRIAVPAYAAQHASPKVVTWNAAGPAETSGPFERAGHGLFTYFVVGALRGWADGEFDDRPDGSVTLGEARQFVYDAVRTVGGGEQNPAFEGTADDGLRLVQGAALERRPELDGLVRAARGAEPTDAPKPAASAAPAPGGDFAARLEELTRIRAEREENERRERELLAQVETERSERAETLAAPIRQVATRAWQQTEAVLGGGGPEAAMAARLYVDTYGATTVDVDGTAVPVRIPEVDAARSWLAAHAEAAPGRPAPAAPEPVAAAPAPAVDPLTLYQELSAHPDWTMPAASQKLGNKLSKKIRKSPNDDELWGDAGDAANAAGDGELATFFYLHALDLDPSDAEWGARLTDLGLPSARPAALAARLRLDPSSDEAWGDFGDGLLVDSEPAAACFAWGRALALDPGDSEWPGKLAENGCAAMSGGRGDAVTQAKRDLDADPQSDERMGDYADALMAAGQVSEACGWYRQALDHDPGDSEWPGKLMGCLETGMVVPTRSSAPTTSPEVLLSRIGAAHGDLGGLVTSAKISLADDEIWGDLGDALGADPLAADAYAVAMRLDPADSEWQRKIVERGGYDRAFAVFEEILAANPSSDERLGDYGDKLFEAGRTADACNAWRAALRFDPEDTEWPGKVQQCDGGAPASSAAAASVPEDTGVPGLDLVLRELRADPGNDERWGDWGDALEALSRHADACAAWQRANGIDPGDSEWTGKLTEHACGGAVAQVAELALDDERMGDLGDERLGRGDVAGACQAYEAALDADPADSEWQRKSLECLVRLDPAGDEAIGDLGDRLASHGQLPAACAAYREALRIDADDSEWKERRKDCRGVE